MTTTQLLQDLGRRYARAEAKYHKCRRSLEQTREAHGVQIGGEYTHPATAQAQAAIMEAVGERRAYGKMARDTIEATGRQRRRYEHIFYEAVDQEQERIIAEG